MPHIIARLARLGAFAAVAAALPSAGAQAPLRAGPRWQAMLGCWSPVRAGESPFAATDNAALVCVTPASNGDAVQLSTIADGRVIATDTIDATGASRPVSARDCTGTRRAQWSADERRVFVVSSFTCQGVETATSQLLALTQDGEWLDVRGVKTGDAETVRVARYRDVGVPSGVPSSIASALAGRELATTSARAVASAPAGTNAVIEASHLAAVPVVEAWILERGQPFTLDGAALVALADAGVNGRVTDAMVAVSNPRAFSFARREPTITRNRDGDIETGRRIPVTMEPDIWGVGYGPYGPGSWYDPYYRYGYGRGYGYGGYGGGYYPPIIVVNGGSVDQGAKADGRAVKGRGYSEGERGTSSGSSRPSTSSSGSSGSSEGSKPASSPAPAPSTQRTAKPRP